MAMNGRRAERLELGGAPPPGLVAGPPARRRAHTNDIASVTTMSGTPLKTISPPLSAPIARRASISPSAISSAVGEACPPSSKRRAR